MELDKLSQFIIFLIIYFYICNWFQINTFVTHLFQKNSFNIIEDNKITSSIQQKTGLEIKKIIIFNSERLFGMMPGIPVKPNLILSRGLYENSKQDELEWVLLHEAAHCKFWHVPIISFIQLLLFLIGLYGLQQLNLPTFLAPIYSILFSLIFIQIAKLFEYQADYFSINRVSNPSAVISAQEKFINNNRGILYSNKIFRLLFYWNISFSTRISLAKKRIPNL